VLASRMSAACAAARQHCKTVIRDDGQGSLCVCGRAGGVTLVVSAKQRVCEAPLRMTDVGAKGAPLTSCLAPLLHLCYRPRGKQTKALVERCGDRCNSARDNAAAVAKAACGCDDDDADSSRFTASLAKTLKCRRSFVFTPAFGLISFTRD